MEARSWVVWRGWQGVTGGPGEMQEGGGGDSAIGWLQQRMRRNPIASNLTPPSLDGSSTRRSGISAPPISPAVLLPSSKRFYLVWAVVTGITVVVCSWWLCWECAHINGGAISLTEMFNLSKITIELGTNGIFVTRWKNSKKKARYTVECEVLRWKQSKVIASSFIGVHR